MKRILHLSALLSFLFLTNCGLSTSDQEKDQKIAESIMGKYFNEIPPGDSAILFGAGIISTGMHEDGGPVYSSDGNEVYYRIAQAPHSIIVTRKQVDGIWTNPEIASFSGQYSDGVPAMHPNDNRIFFESNRPDSEKSRTKIHEDIWYVDRNQKGWSEPMILDSTINSAYNEFGPSVARNGNLYFTSKSEDPGKTMLRIFYSRMIDDKYQKRDDLGEMINEPDAACPCIAPDESFLIFSSGLREDSYGGLDLYISFKNQNGSWRKPINLGPKINSEADDYFPSLSTDGNNLFFSSNRAEKWSFSKQKRTYKEMKTIYSGPGNGRNDIYWVSTYEILSLM